MKASKFTDAQKAFVITQGEEGTLVAEICCKAGVSQATYFNWKKKYAGLLPTEMKRLKQREDENGRMKKIVADLTLDREMSNRFQQRPPFRVQSRPLLGRRICDRGGGSARRSGWQWGVRSSSAGRAQSDRRCMTSSGVFPWVAEVAV